MPQYGVPEGFGDWESFFRVAGTPTKERRLLEMPREHRGDLALDWTQPEGQDKELAAMAGRSRMAPWAGRTAEFALLDAKQQRYQNLLQMLDEADKAAWAESYASAAGGRPERAGKFRMPAGSEGKLYGGLEKKDGTWGVPEGQGWGLDDLYRYGKAKGWFGTKVDLTVKDKADLFKSSVEKAQKQVTMELKPYWDEMQGAYIVDGRKLSGQDVRRMVDNLSKRYMNQWTAGMGSQMSVDWPRYDPSTGKGRKLEEKDGKIYVTINGKTYMAPKDAIMQKLSDKRIAGSKPGQKGTQGVVEQGAKLRDLISAPAAVPDPDFDAAGKTRDLEPAAGAPTDTIPGPEPQSAEKQDNKIIQSPITGKFYSPTEAMGAIGKWVFGGTPEAEFGEASSQFEDSSLLEMPPLEERKIGFAMPGSGGFGAPIPGRGQMMKFLSGMAEAPQEGGQEMAPPLGDSLQASVEDFKGWAGGPPFGQLEPNIEQFFNSLSDFGPIQPTEYQQAILDYLRSRSAKGERRGFPRNYRGAYPQVY